ncbi:hypothetical protein AB4099_28430 [Bosea sp. 2KB_26]|uniref:hypothetical protein n=1 Tax=Bosea sp. 2KB_26 TaxID=3237475 RepID=UPI003F901DFD
MAFKTVESILQPDPRFADLCVVQNGVTRRFGLKGTAPADVVAGFDRARNTIIYAFFDYDAKRRRLVRSSWR